MAIEGLHGHPTHQNAGTCRGESDGCNTGSQQADSNGAFIAAQWLLQSCGKGWGRREGWGRDAPVVHLAGLAFPLALPAAVAVAVAVPVAVPLALAVLVASPVAPLRSAPGSSSDAFGASDL